MCSRTWAANQPQWVEEKIQIKIRMQILKCWRWKIHYTRWENAIKVKIDTSCVNGKWLCKLCKGSKGRGGGWVLRKGDKKLSVIWIFLILYCHFYVLYCFMLINYLMNSYISINTLNCFSFQCTFKIFTFMFFFDNCFNTRFTHLHFAWSFSFIISC